MVTDAESKAAMELHRPVEPAPLATTDVAPLSFEGFVQAVSTGKMSAEAVEKLTDVFLKVQAARAEQDYNVAFANFQEDCPKIPRNRKADIVTKQGGRIKYAYADIEQVMETIGPVLARHGLSVSFDDSTIDANMLTAVCRCSHIGGHSRVSKFTCTTDTSAGMSPQQKAGNAATYAQRRALNQRLGLTTGDPDNDGNEPPAPSPLLTEQQRKHIVKLAGEVKQNWDDLLKWWGVSKNEQTGNREIAEATQDRYLAAVDFLNRKLAEQTKGTA